MAGPVLRDIEFNIETYGADPTGSAESTDAVRQAISEANSARGGTVIVPPGTYRITDTVTLPGPMQLHGASPVTSRIMLDVTDDRAAFSLPGIQGAIIRDLGVAAVNRGTGTGLSLSGLSSPDPYGATGLRTNLNNLGFENLRIGLRIVNCANVDISSINILWFSQYGIHASGGGADLCMSKVHMWNLKNPAAMAHNYGMLLEGVSGVFCSDSDFIGAYVGVQIDVSPGGENAWLTFSQVQCDTVDLDAWHVDNIKGLQMINCWSGTFFQGTGTWFGANVESASVVNHQWQDGGIALSCLNPNGVLFNGGIMGPRIKSQFVGRAPIITNVLGYPEQLPIQPALPNDNAVRNTYGRPANVYVFGGDVSRVLLYPASGGQPSTVASASPTTVHLESGEYIQVRWGSNPPSWVWILD
jgi:Pectate lyase superfamily protein